MPETWCPQSRCSGTCACERTAAALRPIAMTGSSTVAVSRLFARRWTTSSRSSGADVSLGAELFGNIVPVGKRPRLSARVEKFSATRLSVSRRRCRPVAHVSFSRSLSTDEQMRGEGGLLARRLPIDSGAGACVGQRHTTRGRGISMREIIWKNERGLALPMAVLLLLVLTSLMLAFVSLAQTEPMIAKNHLLATQARAQAEAGFERAVWALSQGAIAKAVPAAIPQYAIDPALLPIDGSVAPAPYNGSVYVVSGTTGGFEVTVTRKPGMGTNQREVEAIGYAPGNTALTRSRRRIVATVEKLPDVAFDTPCALCVKGDVGVGGNSTIDATLDTSCGNKLGVVSSGTTTRGPSANIKGAVDGNNIANQSTDYQQNAPSSNFDSITLSAKNFNTLRALAQLNGTYFGPGSPNGTVASSPAYTGSVHFSASNQVKNGIVFIDTVSGNDIPTVMSQQNPADFASVVIDGNPFIGDQSSPNQFKGWIVVNGSLAISGNMKINGLVYVVNDLTYNGTGTGEINGLAVSQNIRDTTETAISTLVDPDSTTTGNSRVKFNCSYTRSWQFIPQNFRLQAGTYREVSD